MIFLQIRASANMKCNRFVGSKWEKNNPNIGEKLPGCVTEQQHTSPTYFHNQSSIDATEYSADNSTQDFGILNCIGKCSSKQKNKKALERDHKSHTIEDANGNASQMQVYFGI